MDAGMLQRLRTASVQVMDLPGRTLGLALRDTIFIDSDAAGHGWFLDATADRDEEFAMLDDHGQAVVGPALGRVDLLSVLLHEMGHLAGGDHDDAADELMSAVLNAGERLLPAAQ